MGAYGLEHGTGHHRSALRGFELANLDIKQPVARPKESGGQVRPALQDVVAEPAKRKAAPRATRRA